MDKKTLVLDAMEKLIIEDKGMACTVSDIAKQAGIGKGSIYYYFKSKEEILDALVERTYDGVIENCNEIIKNSTLSAVDNLELLFKSYYSSNVNNFIDVYLHEPQNAYIHQKSLSTILLKLSPILTTVIEQGIKENIFSCSYPNEFSEIILSELCFVFDCGLFLWTQEQMIKKLYAVIEFMERGLLAPKGSFNFLIEFPLSNSQ